MRAFILSIAICGLTALPALAQQSHQPPPPQRGFVGGSGGFASDTDATSADLMVEGGVRVLPHIMAYGNFGQFRNLEPSEIQPTINDAAAAFTANEGVDVAGSDRVPALYTTGGIRYEPSLFRHALPYVVGGVGVAHLTPSAEFTSGNGTLPDGTSLSTGQEVTGQLISAGLFTAPTSTNAFMMSFGGGLQMIFAKHWSADAGYRFSRVETDSPINTEGVTVGMGFRF